MTRPIPLHPQLRELWSFHQTTTVPDELRYATAGDVAFVFVDSIAAGCLDTFFTTGTLDDERRGAIETCAEQARTFPPCVMRDARSYCDRLLQLIDSVLTATA